MLEIRILMAAHNTRSLVRLHEEEFSIVEEEFMLFLQELINSFCAEDELPVSDFLARRSNVSSY
jgi:sulfate adenylyltransferase subunit 1 (EFTu-like GTPase family)